MNTETYLVVSKTFPYQAYCVGGLNYCEDKLKLKTYSKGFMLRKAIDNSDGCYRIVCKDIVIATIGFLAFKRALETCYQEGQQLIFTGTERDWLVMVHQDVCIQDSIRGFGRDISQKWSKELYKKEL